MKSIWIVLALCHLILGTPESDAYLESLLAKDEIILTSEMLEYRKALFEASWLVKEEGEKLSMEAMYTLAELEKQKGGGYIPFLKTSVQIEKRGEFDWTNISTPAVYDPRQLTISEKKGKVPMLNKAVNQQTCGNCYLHTFVAALEIAYVKATGTKVKFSEQELTDCYFKGCDGGDYRMVTVLMSYIDKLSSKENYGPYLDEKYTCRQANTPDNLDKIKIKGQVTVTPANVQAAIVSFGSVMTCMKWGVKEDEGCRMDNYRAGTVVDYPAFEGLAEGRCEHALLIVGYTPAFYIVRNSHGVTWGDEGYFFIKRRTNSCGIEEHMASIAVEIRTKKDKKKLKKNGCPKDKPTYCKATNLCIGNKEECIGTDKGNKKQLEKRSISATGDSNSNEEIVLQKRCADEHSQCKLLKEKLTCTHEIVMKYCKKSCDQCGGSEGEEVVPPKPNNDLEKRGNCYRPSIAKGIVKNGPLMETGEKLEVECKKGYTLTGKPVTCLIQNVFTNEDKDGRLMPECIKLGSDDLVGNGAKYSGSKNTYTDKIKGEVSCDSWNKDVLEGILAGDMEGYKSLLGNHNYCRNPSGSDPVPKCLSSETGGGKNAVPVYCFPHPGCDTCKGVTSDAYPADYCQTSVQQGECAYGANEAKERQDFFWKNCQASCCKAYCPE